VRITPPAAIFDLIMMDMEGAELLALRGAPQR
jgi:hypothetical protein